MRHDRNGDLIDDDQVDDVHQCRNGWVDRDAEPAVPCLICRPHLAPIDHRRPPVDVDQVHRGVQLVRAALAEARARRHPPTPTGGATP